MKPEWIKNSGALVLKRPPHADNDDITYDAVRESLSARGGYFARWTTEFDCKEQTKWWYCIKDTPVDLEKCSSKQRYRIKKGIQNNRVVLLNQDEVKRHLDSICDVFEACNNSYGSTKQDINRYSFKENFPKITGDADVWGVFDANSNKLIGYCICRTECDVAHLSTVKIIPEALKSEANAALAYQICIYYINERHFQYVCDGERNIRHETNYQDYLIKTLGFRYAYCHLHVQYRPVVGFLIYILYPIRGFLYYLRKKHPVFFNVYCVLKQESYTK